MKNAHLNINERIQPGLKPVNELLLTEPRRVAKVFLKQFNKDIISLCRKNGIPFELTDAAHLESLCGPDDYVAHQGVIAILSQANFIEPIELLRNADAAPLPLIIACDQVLDPGNIGALCRTAYALGCAGLLLPKHNSAALGPAAFKASAGALERMPVAIATNLARSLDQAEELGLAIYGAAADENVEKNGPMRVNAFTHNWRLPATLVLGNENKGIRPGVLKRCSIIISIPMARRFDSLNIAQAGAILTALCARQASLNGN